MCANEFLSVTDGALCAGRRCVGDIFPLSLAIALENNNNMCFLSRLPRIEALLSTSTWPRDEYVNRKFKPIRCLDSLQQTDSHRANRSVSMKT